MIKSKLLNNKKNNKTKKKTKVSKSYKVSKTYKQSGHGVFNTISGQIFRNTKKKDLSGKLPGSGIFNSFKSLTQPQQQTQIQKQNNILTIMYNYRTPYQIIITNNSIDKTFESSRLLSVPHIQIDSIKQFLLIMILPGIQPKLMWGVEFKYRSKVKTVINYLLPKYTVNFKYKLIFKLYKYPDNIKKTFSLIDISTSKRKNAYRKLNKYLVRHNMLKSSIAFKEINVIQDKGSDINTIFKELIK